MDQTVPAQPDAVLATAVPADEDESVAAERVKLLYANVPMSQTVTLVNGALLAIVQHNVVESTRIAAWLACLILVTLARATGAMRFARLSPPDGEISRWRTYFYVGAAASAVVWGAAGLILYPSHSVPHQTFLAFVLGGMVAGSMTVLTPIFAMFALFTVVALAPIIVRFLADADPMHYAMAALCSIFLLAMLAIGKRVQMTIEQTLRLRFENQALIARLKTEKAHVETANAGLLAAQDDLKKANEALESRVRERTAALEEMDRRKDDFLATLSHELRNPLAPISASIYILNRVDPASPQARHALAVIERQTHHVNRLVDDLLDVTRIVRGKIQLHREPVDLTELVTRTIDDHRSIFRQFDVGLTADLPPAAVLVHVDRTRMAQVIGNLLQNAAKFTPAGGKAEVTLRAVEGHAELRIRDTGAGIAPELFPVLFEPFSQGDRSLARTGGGLGLGLALARDIVALHGGTIGVESAGPGQGSTFIVRVQLHAPDGAEENPALKSRVHSSVRHVLVVDDNHDAAEMLAEMVRMFGHTADVAYDGPGAVEKARAHPPDVVLCDIGLPGVSGYDVARMLRAEHRDARLVAVSGYAQPQDALKASTAGFDGHVAKPPDPETLKSLLQETPAPGAGRRFG